MEISSSLDWNDVSKHLVSNLNALPYNRDLLKMYKNIEGMVSELSKREVDARRTHKYYLVAEKITDINSAIDRLEKLLLIAKLVS